MLIWYKKKQEMLMGRGEMCASLGALQPATWLKMYPRAANMMQKKWWRRAGGHAHVISPVLCAPDGSMHAASQIDAAS